MTESTDLVVAAPLNISLDVAQNIKRKLGQKTPKQYRYTRPGPFDARTGQAKKLTYSPWGYTARVLNQTFGPAWSFTYEESDIKRIPLPPLPARAPKGRQPGRDEVLREEVMVTVTLTTPFGKHVATASHTYYPSNAEILFGDVVQSAASKALRRAGARIGIGLDLYLNDDTEALEEPDGADDRAVWKAACAKHGLLETAAVALLSDTLTGDQTSLRTLPDLMMAVDGDVWAVAARLDEAVATITVEATK